MLKDNKEFYKRLEKQLSLSSDWPSIYKFKFILKSDSINIDTLKNIFNDIDSKISSNLSSSKNFMSITIIANMESPLEVICGAILVQNTTWGNAYTALTQLIKSEKLCINQINEMEIVELEQLIRSSGTYKAKAQALKGLAELVVTTDEGTLDAFLKIKTFLSSLILLNTLV